MHIWMPAGIYGWMLWPRGRGIYPQMLPPASRLRYRPGAQAEHDGAIVPQLPRRSVGFHVQPLACPL
jgi:hypothetical protein